MQQRQWNREHIQYTIYPYSQQEEREMYKWDDRVRSAASDCETCVFSQQIRSTLKEQMQEKVLADRQDQQLKNREAQLLI